jgi:hypothetical protein
VKGSGIDLTNITGISLLFLSCLVFAGYGVLARSLLRTFSPAEISYLMLGIGFVTFLVGSLTDHATAGTLDHFTTARQQQFYRVDSLPRSDVFAPNSIDGKLRLVQNRSFKNERILQSVDYRLYCCWYDIPQRRVNDVFDYRFGVGYSGGYGNDSFGAKKSKDTNVQ